MGKNIAGKWAFIWMGVWLLSWGWVINATALEKEYPTQSVEVVAPFGVGTNADLLARIISPHLERHFKQPFYVLNKGGGGGVEGHNYVANSKPDGYRILSLNSVYGSFFATRKADEIHFKFDSFAPVVGYAETQLFLNVKKDAPWKTLNQFLDEAKKKPEQMRYATVATLGTAHVVATNLFKLAGVKITHIPGKGASDAITQVLGGHVDMCVMQGSAGHLGAGTVRALAIAAEKRRPDYPEVPTLQELGFPVIRPSIVGLAVPAGTPREIIDRLYKATKEIMTTHQEEIQKQLFRIEAIPVLFDPDKYLEQCKADRDYFSRMVPEIKKELRIR